MYIYIYIYICIYITISNNNLWLKFRVASRSMASTALAPGMECRLSSWPVRRERQRIAQNVSLQSMRNLEGKMDMALERINKLSDMLAKQTLITPPGLSKEMPLAMCDRLDRLESLLICSPILSPSVDELLDQMLANQKKRCTCTTNGFEPDAEASPLKAHNPQKLLEVSEPVPSKCLVFDMFEEEDEKHIQFQVSTATAATQTPAYVKARKSRCNGRAVQTESSCILCMTPASDDNENVNEKICTAPAKDDNENVNAKLCTVPAKDDNEIVNEDLYGPCRR